MRFQDSWWNISVSGLVILAASVVEISCKNDKQTNKETNTHADEHPTHVTTVGSAWVLGNNSIEP